jgi:zinc transporter ZupT
VWFAAFIGLSVHSLVTGRGVSSLPRDGAVLWPLVGALAVHKAGESFSLATVMRLAGLRRRRAVGLLLAYCLAAPLGLLAGSVVALEIRDSGLESAITGLAAGTFLYVAVGDLLPEVFHGGVARWERAAALLLGIAVAAAGVSALH